MKSKDKKTNAVASSASKSTSNSEKINQLFVQKQMIVKSMQSKNVKSTSQVDGIDPVLEWL